MKKVIDLFANLKESELPTNIMRVDSIETVRIPILDRMYEINDELYYEIQGDPTPRKWKDYSQKNFD